MKPFINDTNGTAYSIFIIIMIFVLASVVMIVSLPAFNNAIDQYNSEFVDKDIASQRTVDTLEFQFNMFRAMPFFVAFTLLFLYPIVVALLKRRTGD